jgi:hypothetical protein
MSRSYDLVLMACWLARQASANGSRPIYKQCSKRKDTYLYTVEPDAPLIVALKRGYKALQRQSSGGHGDYDSTSTEQ